MTPNGTHGRDRRMRSAVPATTAGVRAALVATAVVAWATASLHGQARMSESTLRLQQWLTAVMDHVPGQLDPAVETVAAWSESELNAGLNELQRQVRLSQLGRASVEAIPLLHRYHIADSASMNRTLKLAAVLHADAAILHRTSVGYSLPSYGGAVRVISDGRQIARVGGTAHWPFARALLAAMQPRSARDEYVRLWYHATAAFFQYWNDYAQGPSHLSEARALFPNDAMFLTFEGALHEAYAEERLQRAVAQSGAVTNSIASAAEEWHTAESRFRDALKADDKATEARIRLGHVLEMRGRHQEAVVELERALADEPPRVMKYFALLFLGRTDHALGRFDEARVAFTQARIIFPGAQAPLLGFSHVMRDSGDKAAALDGLGPLSELAEASNRHDPYLLYRQTHAPDLEMLLDALGRAAVGLRLEAISPAPSAERRPRTSESPSQ